MGYALLVRRKANGYTETLNGYSARSELYNEDPWHTVPVHNHISVGMPLLYSVKASHADPGFCFV